jgi:hypothetical protein
MTRLRWCKGIIVEGFGVLYHTECRRFLIEHREEEQEYRLVQFFQDGRFTKDSYKQLKSAKSVAETRAVFAEPVVQANVLQSAAS